MSTNTTDDNEQLARDGDYFLKRDRNKDGTIGIYTAKKLTSGHGRVGYQTVRIAPTSTSDPVLAEIALKRFVLTSKEALQKERERKMHGESKAIDRPIMDVLNMYYLGHAEAKNPDFARGVRSAIRTVEEAWPDNPMCSTLDRDKQKEFVAHTRSKGWSDSTTATRLSFIWAAMRWCDAGGRLAKFPGKIQNEEWEADLSSEREPYTLDELARLFDAARGNANHWRYMVCALGTASRPTALMELTWPQFDIEHQLCRLNPVGRRQTKKRRATVRMCPTFLNEVSTWERVGEHVIALESVKFFRDVLARHAGIENGFPMRMRHTVRTWLAEQGVPDAKADIFMGHAEEGSATGRKFYKKLKPTYLIECAQAIEALFVEIAGRTGRPFAGMGRVIRPVKLTEIVASWALGAANEPLFDTLPWHLRDKPSGNSLIPDDVFDFSGNNVDPVM